MSNTPSSSEAVGEPHPSSSEAVGEHHSRFDAETGQTTTGHSYDGIEELNTPLPRWWLWTFYATIIWGLAYTIAYPAWPLISSATAGVLGYSTRAEVAANIAAHDAANAALATELVAADLATLDPGSDLHRYAVARGGAVFRAQCSQCHGSGAAGATGYPNLLDNDWLWGGDIETIAYTVRHGIRNDTDPDAHYSEMPAFGDILEKEEIEALADYVLTTLPTLNAPDESSETGLSYLDNCSSCHGEQGEGNQDLGAPNLADAIWLYGGEKDSVITSITNARYGVMPAWGKRLTNQDIQAVAIYIHQLGGGK